MPGLVPPALTINATAVVDLHKEVFSFADLQNLWIQAGGNPAKAKIAAAVAMAESGGRRTAQHRNSDGSIDRGPWQINSVHGAQSTLDPRGNARAAVAISKNGTSWTPWVTFKSGAYQRFLSGHNVPAAAVASGESVPGVTDLNLPSVPVPDGLKAIGGFLGRLGVIFEADWWKRVGMVLAGLVAILLGVVWVAKEYAPANLPIPPIIP